MCMTCGCNKPNERHGNPDNITMEDIQKAAKAAKISPDQAVRNIDTTMRTAGAGQQSQRMS
ncbi:MAG: hypothetical protein U0822_10440 [Anaerolineae bacterium]